jgi:hypothetical protein
VATVISAEVFKANAEGVRASVNNHLFVEAEVMTANAAGVDCKIRAGVGAGIVVVDTWDPADNSYQVEHHAPFNVNLHAHANSAEFTKLYDDGVDFDTGTYDDTQADDSGLTLATSTPFVDFEDYTSGYALASVSNPDSWTRLDQKADSNTTIRSDPVNSGELSVRGGVVNSKLQHRLNDAGTMYAGTVTARFQFAATQDLSFSLTFQHTGSGTALRGYAATVSRGGTYIVFHRMNDWDSFYGVVSRDHGVSFVVGDWYWMKIQFWGESTTSSQYKIWKDGDSEPGSFSWLGSDSSYTREGYVGACTTHPSTFAYVYWDDFEIVPSPTPYVSSGDWESGLIDTTSIVQYGGGRITWTETLPTDTTAVVKCRWRNGGSWLTVTNDDPIPGITAGEDTKAGSSKDSLELRVELATTASTSTPVIDDLKVYHEPFENALAKITIDPTGGDIDCTEANGYLEIWGKAQVSGGAHITAWDDITLETYQPYELLGPARSMAVQLWYDTWLVEDIAITLKPDYWMVSNAEGEWRFSMNPIKYEGPPVEIRWNCQTPWFPGGHGYEWVLIDYSMGMRQDASFLVGHYQLDDVPGFYIAGALNLGDHPGFYLAEGYQRDDHTGFYLSQAYKRDDQPGFYMPGIWTLSDHVGFFVTAVRRLDDHHGSFLVRGVNADGTIEASIIDADAWAELVARGYTRG